MLQYLSPTELEIEGSTTFRGDIHESIRKTEENNRYKVIGYCLFGKTYIIKPNTPDGLIDLHLDYFFFIKKNYLKHY